MSRIAEQLERAMGGQPVAQLASLAATNQATRLTLASLAVGADMNSAVALCSGCVQLYVGWAEQQQQTPIALSVEASRLLRELLAELRSVQGLQAQAERARVAFQETFQRTEAVVGSARELLLDASAVMVRASRGSTAPPMSAEAATLIRGAAARLAGMYENGQPGPMGVRVGQVLEGAALWAEGRIPTELVAMFQPVAYGNAQQTRGLASNVQPRLSQILEDHCPEGTWLRVATLTVLVVPIWLMHPKAAEREPLIRVTLELFPCAHEGHNREAFVAALANLFATGQKA